jgi:phage terminase large subunit
MDEDRVLWVKNLTERKDLVWHKVDGDVNEHLDEQKLKNAYMVSHSSDRVGRRFGGAYIGFRGKRKVLCFVLVDGVGNWIYIDATYSEKEPVKKLFSTVKKMATKQSECNRCKSLGWV